MKMNRYEKITALIREMVPTGKIAERIAENLYTIVEEETGVPYQDLHDISEKLEWIKDDPDSNEVNMSFFIAETHSHRPVAVINFIKNYLTRITDTHGPIYDINAVVDALEGRNA